MDYTTGQLYESGQYLPTVQGGAGYQPVTVNLSPEQLAYQQRLRTLRATGERSAEISIPGLEFSPDYRDQTGGELALFSNSYYSTNPGGLGTGARYTVAGPNVAQLSQQASQTAYNTAVAQSQPQQIASTTQQVQPIQPVQQVQNQPTQTLQTTQPNTQLANLPNLAPGSQGPDVLNLQNYLVSQGYLTQADLATGPGIYGPKTTAAVAAMQQALGIDAQGNPGYFGPITKQALQGQQGGTSQIADLQKQVQELQGMQTTIDDARTKGFTDPSNTTDTYQKAVDFLAQHNVQIDPNKATTNPEASWTKTYQDLFTSLGLDKVKEQINKNIEEIGKIDQELIEKIAEINDNPWLSEGVRVSRIRSLEAKYEQKKAALANTLTLYQSTYNEGRQEAQFLVTTAMSQFNRDREFDLDQQKFLADQAEAASEARSKLGKIDPSRFKEVQGGLYDVETGKFVVSPKGDTSGMDDFLSVTEADALGVPYGTRKSEAFGKTVTGQPTVDESKARQFAVSAANANNILNSGVYDIGSVEIWKPELFKSDARQQFEQAARAFVNSVLRRESGATITDAEFNNKYKELIPQAGEKAGVLANKEAARNAAVLSIQQAGGNVSNGSVGGDVEADLKDTILAHTNDYPTREVLIDTLISKFPELTESEIAHWVYTLIPDR